MLKISVGCVVLMCCLTGTAQGATLDNYLAAKSGIESAGFTVEDINKNPCNNENSCSGYIGPTMLSAIGKTVEIFTSSSISEDDYMFMCAGAAAGLNNAPIEQVAAIVGLIYGVAVSFDEADHDFGPVRLDMTKDSSGSVGCSFTVY